MLPDTYVHSLLAAALDYVDAPLPPPPYQVTLPESAADQGGAGAANKPPSKHKRDAAPSAATAAASAADGPAGHGGVEAPPATAEDPGDSSAAMPAAGVDNATLAALLLADDAEPDDAPAAPDIAGLGGGGAAGSGAVPEAGREGHSQPADPTSHSDEVAHDALFALPEAPELPPELAGEPGSPISAPNQAHARLPELPPELAGEHASLSAAPDQADGAEMSPRPVPGHADVSSSLVAQAQARAHAPATPAPAQALLDAVPAEAAAPAQACAEPQAAQAEGAGNPGPWDLATALGALYAAYTLFETQPGTAGGDQGLGLVAGSCPGSRALLYVPPSRLLALGRLAAAAAQVGVRDAAALLRRLIKLGALVVGAVRRPPCGANLPAAASGR